MEGGIKLVSGENGQKLLATLRWDSVDGADSYIVVRDGKEIAGPLRIEGSQKVWTDKSAP